jgi:hypothetical protein
LIAVRGVLQKSTVTNSDTTLMPLLNEDPEETEKLFMVNMGKKGSPSHYSTAYMKHHE